MSRIASKKRSLTVSTDQLRLGMFVAELDRPWLQTPFPLQGVRVDYPEQIEYLRERCQAVVIDLDLSGADAIRDLPQLARSKLAGQGAENTRAKLDRLARGLWQKLRFLFSKEPTVKVAPPPRLKGIPANVELVTYTDRKSFDEAIGPASKVYNSIEETMNTVMRDLVEKREISVDTLRTAADDLAENIADNPEAMMWLARMREQNVRTYQHSVQVAIYMITFGRHLGFPPPYLKKLGMMGLLLDLGMTRVDNELLDRPARLAQAELAEVRKHVEYGLELLSSSPELDFDVREAIAEHHERADGTGYPRGLSGDETSFAGRMAAIADTFAALTSHRPYAECLSAYKSMQVLSEGAGKEFNEPLVEQFIQAIGFFPVGSLVELSSGVVGAVVSHNKIRRLKPRVLVLTDENKQRLDSPYELNLLRDPRDAKGDVLRIMRGLPAEAFGVNPRDYYLK